MSRKITAQPQRRRGLPRQFVYLFTFLFVVFSLSLSAQTVDRKAMSASVKAEFLHAWEGYKKFCWGHDDLKPVSKTCRDWYGTPILMTPVDSLDSLYILEFKKEADATREYIARNLSFDKDIDVQNFEITIRILGGLLSSYQITGDKRLLSLADDLGTRLLPVFNSPTGLPYKFVNLKTGKVREANTNPAETGTLLIEFGTLSKLTGKPIYYEKAKRALVETYNRRSPIGLVGTNINVETGKWTNTSARRSILTTNTCLNAPSFSTTWIAAGCGKTRSARCTHISPTKART